MSEAEQRNAWLRKFADWIKQCADVDGAFAMTCAEAGAEMQQEQFGDDAAQWDDPEDCADDEMDCWDGDEP